MVGGTVIECCDHPTDRSRIYINCANRGKNQKRADECAIYVARNQDSEQIEIGDSIWWQGSWAMWTPQRNRVNSEDAENRLLKCGVDYDIQIPRVGYSGVNHPTKGTR